MILSFCFLTCHLCKSFTFCSFHDKMVLGSMGRGILSFQWSLVDCGLWYFLMSSHIFWGHWEFCLLEVIPIFPVDDLHHCLLSQAHLLLWTPCPNFRPSSVQLSYSFPWNLYTPYCFLFIFHSVLYSVRPALGLVTSFPFAIVLCLGYTEHTVMVTAELRLHTCREVRDQ